MTQLHTQGLQLCLQGSVAAPPSLASTHDAFVPHGLTAAQLHHHQLQVVHRIVDRVTAATAATATSAPCTRCHFRRRLGCHESGELLNLRLHLSLLCGAGSIDLCLHLGQPRLHLGLPVGPRSIDLGQLHLQLCLPGCQLLDGSAHARCAETGLGEGLLHHRHGLKGGGGGGVIGKLQKEAMNGAGSKQMTGLLG